MTLSGSQSTRALMSSSEAEESDEEEDEESGMEAGAGLRRGHRRPPTLQLRGETDQCGRGSIIGTRQQMIAFLKLHPPM